MLRLVWAIIAALFSGLRSRRGLMPGEPRPPSAALHRPAEAPAADRAGGPGVLGRAAPAVVRMVRCGRHREARDGDWLAPRGLRAVLDVALQAEKVAWPGSGRPGSPRSCPEDGERERVGSSRDPRRVDEAGVQGLRARRVALHAAARPLAGAEAELAHVPPEPQGGDVAMDFFTVPTATFRVLYVWFAIRHPDERSCTGASRRAPRRTASTSSAKFTRRQGVSDPGSSSSLRTILSLSSSGAGSLSTVSLRSML